MSGHVAFEGMGGYAASKHAILGLTRVAATELGAKNIRVVALSPLSVDTPMIRASMAHFGRTMEEAAQALPFRRHDTPDEMAHAVLFLASADATALSGMDLDVTGGWLAK